MSSTCCLKCSQPYHDPLILSCCHSFCTQCIQSIITEDTGAKILSCPFCHQTTPVPKDGVDSLPRNLHLVNKQGDTQSIQGSPFNISVVATRDYTILKNPVQTITGVNNACFIAFSNNGDMFVTSYRNHCIYVYDSNGRQKTIIGSKGTGPLQFTHPIGIAINGDIMYVAEFGGHRVHKLSLGGKYLGTFGSKGSGKRQFDGPYAICIGPDGRIYVTDYSNNRIQVFHQDETFSHSIDSNVLGNKEFSLPFGLCFDHLGHLHMTCDRSNIVTVFTPEGQYIRQYGQSHLNGPCGIAIDSAGNSLVVNNSGHSLSISDPHGNYIHSIEGFSWPVGVAVASNGSVWVADKNNNRLVKY